MRYMRHTVVTVSLLLLLGTTGCGGSDRGLSVGGPGPSEPSSGGGDGDGGQRQPSPPDRPADITGPLTSATPFVAVTEHCTDPADLPPDAAVSSDDPPVCTPADADAVGSIRIEQGTGSVDAASIAVRRATRLLAADGQGGWRPTTFDRLAAGTVVQAWFTGPVAESYPVQATADVITVES